jgi:hypothetical protein
VDFLAPIVAPASAQTLARLHVRDFTMTAEPKSLRVGDTLRLKIVAHLAERVSQLDNVTLPDLSGFDSLGDERVCSSTPSGSECTEIMTLSPTLPGDRTIAPTTLDAIDARNGKPSHFGTNTVTIHIAGVVPQAATPAARTLIDDLLKPLTILLIVGAAAYALLWGAGRRKRLPPPPQPAPRPVAPLPPSDALPQLIAALAQARTRVAVVALRDELRRRVGARDDETLGDLLRRRAAGNDAAFADVLRAIEVGAFVDDAQLSGAIDGALQALSKWRPTA